MKKFIVATALLFLLGGCTRSTTDMLDERTAVVSGRGNAFAKQGDVTRSMLQEAAAQAKSRGYRYFVVSNFQDQTRQVATYRPGTTSTTGSLMTNCVGANCMGTYDAQTRTTPATTSSFIKPGADIQIKYYRDGEIDPRAPGVWDVDSILAVKDGK